MTTPVYLEIGVITRPHGIQGEVRMQTSPEHLEALKGVRRVYLDGSSQGTRILGYRIHQGAVLLRLVGVATRNDADTLRGRRVSIRVNELPQLAEGEYYTHQLIGLQVIDDTDQILGTLKEVLATGSNDVYVVQLPDGKELLLPVIESVIRNIDIKQGIIRVIVPDGLRD